MMPVSSLISGYVRQMTVQNCLNPGPLWNSSVALLWLYTICLLFRMSPLTCLLPHFHKTSSIHQSGFFCEAGSPWNMLVLIMRWDCRAILSACQAWPFAFEPSFLGYCQISISPSPLLPWPVTLSSQLLATARALFHMITSSLSSCGLWRFPSGFLQLCWNSANRGAGAACSPRWAFTHRCL